MNKRKIIAGLLIASVALMNSCKNNENTKKESVQEAAKDRQDEDNKKKIDDLNHEYPKVPDERILDNGDGTALYKELKQRYRTSTATLKQLVEASGAKLVYVILTPEVGKGSPNTSKYGIPFIKETCADLGIECLDFSPIIATQDPKVLTQVPRDGHWSKKGAVFLADHLATLIRKYSDVTSKVTYKDSERPETFGDLPPNDDEIRDGGKDMPYHVKANSQGLRMDHDVKFPKKKKHIFLMGDSAFFCPFLDNEFIISAVLQKTFPDDEIMNSGIICYTVEDYVTLWNEKAKYAEPDLVIVQTNGGDITDLFFTHRNHFSRSGKPFYPSANEEKFYKDNYPH